PALLAWYAGPEGSVHRLDTDAIEITRPPLPRSSGRQAFTRRKGPVRLVSTIRDQSSADSSWNRRRGTLTPAAATSTSRRPGPAGQPWALQSTAARSATAPTSTAPATTAAGSPTRVSAATPPPPTVSRDPARPASAGSRPRTATTHSTVHGGPTARVSWPA